MCFLLIFATENTFAWGRGKCALPVKFFIPMLQYLTHVIYIACFLSLRYCISSNPTFAVDMQFPLVFWYTNFSISLFFWPSESRVCERENEQQRAGTCMYIIKLHKAHKKGFYITNTSTSSTWALAIFSHVAYMRRIDDDDVGLGRCQSWFEDAQKRQSFFEPSCWRKKVSLSYTALPLLLLLLCTHKKKTCT